MREIKFRAWDKINGEMIPWGRLLNGYNLRNVFMGPEMSGLILMQFTGLKDKNGVDIYEGDIVKAYPNNTMYIGEVYYEDGQWFGACDYLDYAVAYSSAEVIGNIYQNKDLLGTVK